MKALNFSIFFNHCLHSKVGYFYLSRAMIISSIENNHLVASKHLKESRDYATWAAEDRSKRTQPLTLEQKKQLQEYLALMASQEKEIYPSKQV